MSNEELAKAITKADAILGDFTFKRGLIGPTVLRKANTK
jgi:hypothetical protein